MNNSKDRQKRYNRSFLNWKKNDILRNSKKSIYKPNFHVYPIIGLLNDPNCVFYKDKKYYIFFQHHLANPIHGLKTMSLAITKDFSDFDYEFMVNKPINEFDSHGIYSGNAINFKDKIIAMYTGNVRDKNWIRTSYIIISYFNIDQKEFINKRVLLDSFDYSNYTEHFRDPYIFKYKNNLFFLLGAQNINNEGRILLFKLSKNLQIAELMKEFKISSDYRMIECPNIIFIKNKAVLIYSPQYKESLLKEDQNPDVVRYMILNIKEIFNSKKQIFVNLNKSNKREQILDYGLEFYAPQTFLKSRKWNIIAWSGIPTSINYPEIKEGWIFVLSMVRELDIKKNKLIMTEPKKYKNNFLNSNFQKVMYKEFYIKIKEKIKLIDSQSEKLIIDFKEDNQIKKIIITRNDDKKYFPYNSVKEIILNKKSNNIKIEIFLDVSIIEIKIDEGKYWYTSRIYLSNSFDFVKF